MLLPTWITLSVRECGGSGSIFVSMITCNFTAFAVLASGMWTDASYQGIQIIFAALKETWHPIIVQVLCLGVALILFTSYLGSYIKFRTSINYIFGDKLERIIKWLYFCRH